MSDSTLSTNSVSYNDFETYDINIIKKDKIKNTIYRNDRLIEKISYYLRTSTLSLRIVIGICLLIFVYKYLKIKKKSPTLILNVYFSSKFLTVSFLTTFIFFFYIYLLPNENVYIQYVKIRATDAFKAYIISLLAFYDLPLPTFWIIFFYDTLFITKADAEL